jgi:hypothetical protein
MIRDLLDSAKVVKRLCVRSSVTAFVLLALVVVLVPAASATSITWTFSDATFVSGGLATGSFAYDADTNTFSAISITVSGSPVGGDGTYTALDPNFPSGASLPVFVPNASLSDFTGTFLVVPQLANVMTDAGGTISIVPDIHGIQVCDSTCGISSEVNVFAGGFITTTPVTSTPEPSSVLLLGSGLCALARRLRH